MACSDVILRMGSIVNSFCNLGEGMDNISLKTVVGINQKEDKMSTISCGFPTPELFRLTKWNALLSGLTLCFSMYFIRLQFVYLSQRKNKYSEKECIEASPPNNTLK